MYMYNYIGIEMYVVFIPSDYRVQLTPTGAYKYHGQGHIWLNASIAHVHNFSKRVCYTYIITLGAAQCHVNTCIIL